jgi:hypothetical protein
MGLRPTRPSVPPELLARFGAPEHVFGPNLRFRVIATVLGGILLLLGVYFFLLQARILGRGVPLSDWVGERLAAGLLLFAVLLIGGACLAQSTWIFVCPSGLLRTRQRDWDAVAWSDVARYEELPISSGFGSNRTCRIVLKSGETWRIVPDYTRDYHRLMEVLQQRLNGNAARECHP